jgi:hypothetical protein
MDGAIRTNVGLDDGRGASTSRQRHRRDILSLKVMLALDALARQHRSIDAQGFIFASADFRNARSTRHK